MCSSYFSINLGGAQLCFSNMPSHEKAPDVFWLLPLEAPLSSDFPEACPSVLSGILRPPVGLRHLCTVCSSLLGAPFCRAHYSAGRTILQGAPFCRAHHSAVYTILQGAPSCGLNSFQMHRLLAQLLQSSCTSLALSASGFKLLFLLLFIYVFRSFAFI